MRKIYDKRLNEYQERNLSGIVQINREFAFLSVVFSWCIQFEEGTGLTRNPCKGIQREKEPIRTRYVSNEEFAIQWKLAARVADFLPVMMEHTYLLACRGKEARMLRLSSVDEEKGYSVKRLKGSKDNIINWSPRLKKAHKAALALRINRRLVSMGDEFLIIGPTGGQLKSHAFQSAMQRLKNLMIAEGVGYIYWTMHDLKKKGITDSKNKFIGGHKSESMKERYNVKTEEFEPAG